MSATPITWSQTSDRLFATLARYERESFTGCVEIRVGADRRWRCSFVSGRLGWIDGGVHPWRAWRRQLAALNDASLPAQADLLEGRRDALVLAQKSLWTLPAQLLGAGKLAPQQFASLLSGLCRESLFDMIGEIERRVQESESDGGLKIAVLENEKPLGGSKVPSSWLAMPRQLCDRVRQDWQEWTTALPADLTSCHVNQAPIIVEPKLLEAKLAPTTYQRMSVLLDGKNTLRDLARAVKRSEGFLLCMFEPYLRQGWMRLAVVPDTVPTLERKPSGRKSEERPLQKNARQQMIACVDDSPQILALVEFVARREGYDFVGIGDGLQSIPILIEKKPDLIFLDLVMPIINGYELYQKLSQIRSLRNTPVVMLSSSVLDRVRAKKMGICECLEKPISPRRLTQLMAHYVRQADAVVDREETQPGDPMLAPC